MYINKDIIGENVIKKHIPHLTRWLVRTSLAHSILIDKREQNQHVKAVWDMKSEEKVKSFKQSQ